MLKFTLSVHLIVTFCFYATGQQRIPTPAPTPVPAPVPAPNTIPSRLILPPSIMTGMTNTPFGVLPEADPMARRLLMVQRYALPMYRKPTGKELRFMTPNAVITSTFSNYLRRPATGIVKLVPDSGCAENSKVVNASDKCLDYSMPGAGNSFSFRTENYRIRQLADITYSKDGFEVPGILMHGLMVDLGDVPIESVELNDPAIRYLVDFQPVREFPAALEIDKQLNAGILSNGAIIRRHLPVVPNHTYAVRNVAYRGKVMRSVRGADYNELDFDKRQDVVTVFRVADTADDGSVTIVWGKLRAVAAPKLTVRPDKSMPTQANEWRERDEIPRDKPDR